MKYNFQLFLRLFLLLVLSACGSHSLEDFREEGESITRSLIKELQTIRTRDDLVQIAPRLQKLFDRLVDTIVTAREFLDKYPKLEIEEFSQKNHDLSDQLRIELNRIYCIEGGRELIEKCQESALHRLDAFEKRANKYKKNIS